MSRQRPPFRADQVRSLLPTFFTRPFTITINGLTFRELAANGGDDRHAT